jgi:hypothetical protein
MRLPESGERCRRHQKKHREAVGENSPAWRTISRRAPCDLWDHATQAFARACPNLARAADAD